MNIQHSVNAPALSGKRSMLRRFVTAATMGALLFGVASASADKGKEGKGTYTVTTLAGLKGCKDADNCMGKLDVKGDGKFRVQDQGGNLVFVSHIGGKGDLNMKDGRQKHTCGDENGKDSKLPGLSKDSKAKVIIEKSKLTFPEAGKEVSGEAPAKVQFLDKESSVKVKYTVKEDGGKYVISKASFDFDYTKHTGSQVCLMLICVRPLVAINITNGVVEK
jgi:hypothetical protein